MSRRGKKREQRRLAREEALKTVQRTLDKVANKAKLTPGTYVPVKSQKLGRIYSKERDINEKDHVEYELPQPVVWQVFPGKAK